MRTCSRSRHRLVAACIVAAVSTVAGAAADVRLIQAVKAKDVQAVRDLVKERVDVNAPQGDGTTALHWAARVDDLAIADVLIRAGARAAVANDNGVTPLHLACGNRSQTMVDRLLSAGADANAAMQNGETVLMTCARAGKAEAVHALLTHGARVNASEMAHQQTALMWAAAESHPDVVGLLIEAGADLRARSKIYPETVVGEDTQRAGREELSYTVLAGGMTPLLFATRAGDVESARLLIAAGGDAGDRLPDGTTALVLGAFSGRGEVSALLLDKGADPDDMGSGYTALHAAVLRSDPNLVKALLAHGANPNIRMTRGTPKRRDGEDFHLPATLVGSTPYLLAARFLEADILRALKAGGADTSVSMPNGATPLMLAAGMGSTLNANRRGIRVVDFGKLEPESQAAAAVAAVLSLGADVNAANPAGDTALHSAAAMGYNSVVQLLADHGADLNVKNKRGVTPLAALLGGRGGRGRGAAAPPNNDANGDAPGAEVSYSSTIALLRKLGATQ
jgi:ankyrin repeat protein